MLSRPGRLAVAVAAACLLAGCQPPAPTTTPVPTYQCTPEAGGAEFGCSQHQYDDMVAKDKLYAEAEAVYRKFFAEDVRILRSGGLSEPTPGLLETTTGAFLNDSLDYYRSLRADRSKLVGGAVNLVALKRMPGASKGGSLVAMKACIDASSARILLGGKDSGPGRTGSDLLYFGRSDGTLKIQGADGQEGQRCD
jgi:hypothetical protein